MLRLLKTAEQLMDFTYRLDGSYGGITLGEAFERLLSEVEVHEEPEWCPQKTPTTEKRSILAPDQQFFYRPHLFETMEVELEKAHQLQYALLPRELPQQASCRLSAVLESYCHLSGDLFGWHDAGEERLMLWLVDMSGHGARAGILSALIRILIDDLRDVTDPGTLVTELNRRMTACVRVSDDVIYATGAFLLIEPGSLNYVVAAHPPVLRRNGKSTLQRLESAGRPVGVFPGSLYETDTVSLDSENMLLLYTDGILEAGNHGDEEFGQERLERAFLASNGDVAGVTRSIYDAVSAFQDMNSIDDDVTFLAVEC